MKKTEIIFSSILVPIDYILLVLAGLSAYFLRYSEIYATNIREVVFSLSLFDYSKYVFLVALVWLIIFGLTGMYSMRPGRKIFKMLSNIFLGCSTGTLIVIVVFFFSRELFSSRFIILAGWALAILYISLAHLVIRWIQQWFYKKKIGIHRIIFIGGDKTSLLLENEFENNLKLGYQIVYRSNRVDDLLVKQIKKLALNNEIDEIIQADASFNREQTLLLIELANEYHLEFKYAADLLGARKTNIEVHTINGIPIVEIKKTPLDGWGKIVKRLFDIIGAIFFMIIFSPIFLIIPIIIKMDSPGPIIYKDLRVGSKNKKFYLYKFRSMIDKADELREKLMQQNERADGPLFKIENDPRITKIGKFIRKTSIDEIPNFWNVLIGKMSLVGPRPHRPEEVEKYQRHHKKLLNIKPGITGMAQVSGRSTLDFETEVKLDTLYIETWSLWLDIIILLKTPLVLIKFID